MNSPELVPPPPHTSRYEILQFLGQGSMGRVFQARDRLNGDVLALKFVTTADAPASDSKTPLYPTPSELDPDSEATPRLALTREFQSLSSLRHPNVIAVRDYGFTDGLPYFTMDYVADAQTLVDAAVERDSEGRVQLLLQVLQALVYVHRRNIIHRDLKPGNVLVSGDNAYVLDFGLADKTEEAEGTVGTIRYMPPEVLNGQPAGPASDLFSLGVMAYQMFSGKHPFGEGGIITGILSRDPDWEADGLPSPLVPILKQLLEKDPAKRYKNAQTVISDILGVLDRSQTFETEAVRESFLQAAAFVGRQNEMLIFKEAVRDMRDGIGSAWLIAGESGVGKSRVVDEIRVQALVRGVLVLRTQAQQTASSAYTLWGQILRRLVLEADITDEEAGVISSLVPELAEMIDRPVIPAPSLPPHLASARLVETIMGLVARMADAGPVMLILEDMHWSGPESIALLKAMVPLTKQAPLVLIANYRDGEAPEIGQTLDTMQFLKLARLSEIDIANLTASMLGQVEKQEEIVNFLQHETEGNPLFLVEIVRALADEVGQLNRIGSVPLPRTIVTGGLQQLILRRLKRIREDDLPLLYVAAVVEREIDVNLMRIMFPTVDINAWISRAANASVLSVQDEMWRFVHNKLRDNLLANLSQEAKLAAHQQIAEALETRFQGAYQDLVKLVYHWSAVGDQVRIANYTIQAGDATLALGVNLEAKSFYEQGLAALAKMPQDDDLKRRVIDVTLKLARVAAFLPHSNLDAQLETALSLADGLKDDVRQARIYGSIGAYHYVGGRVMQAFNYFTRSMVMAEKLELEDLLLLPYNLIGRALCSVGKYNEGISMLAKGIELAEKYSDMSLLMRSLAFYATGHWFQGRNQLGNEIAQRAMALAKQSGHVSTIAANLMTLGFGYAYRGKFEEAISALTECLALSKQTREMHPMYTAHGTLGYVYMNLGDSDNAIQHLNACLDMASKSQQLTMHLPMYQAFRAELTLQSGNYNAAVQAVEEALTLAEQTQQPLAQAYCQQTMSRMIVAAPNPNWEMGQQLLEDSMAHYEQENNVALAAICQLDLGRFFQAQEDHVSAKRHFLQAQSQFEQLEMSFFRTAVSQLL